jgi:hypothetical protein
MTVAQPGKDKIDGEYSYVSHFAGFGNHWVRGMGRANMQFSS